MNQNITIYLDGPLQAPKIFINGYDCPIVSIEYDYETPSDVSEGSHRLLVEYVDEENVRSTVYTGFDKKV